MEKIYESPTAELVLFNGVRVVADEPFGGDPDVPYDPANPAPEPPHPGPYQWQSRW